jgi:hypothetical protein
LLTAKPQSLRVMKALLGVEIQINFGTAAVCAGL